MIERGVVLEFVAEGGAVLATEWVPIDTSVPVPDGIDAVYVQGMYEIST